jgi:hypothetical protein
MHISFVTHNVINGTGAGAEQTTHRMLVNQHQLVATPICPWWWSTGSDEVLCLIVLLMARCLVLLVRRRIA